MTTKEEVLRLLSDCGYCSGYVYRILVDGKMTGKFTDFIDNLIELAKQAGAKEERQRWNVNMPDWQYIFSRSCQRAHPHEEMNDECQEITKRLRAIRNREIIEPIK